MKNKQKDIVWLNNEIKTPPFSEDARIEAGWLIRRLQLGEKLRLPESRPMPDIGTRCHELRIQDKNIYWRIVYHLNIELNEIVILEIFNKKTGKTPKSIIDTCQKRLTYYYGKSLTRR